MGASECRGKPPNALRAKGVEKEEEGQQQQQQQQIRSALPILSSFK
jgi:hypothetical protein